MEAARNALARWSEVDQQLTAALHFRMAVDASELLRAGTAAIHALTTAIAAAEQSGYRSTRTTATCAVRDALTHVLWVLRVPVLESIESVRAPAEAAMMSPLRSNPHRE